MKHDARFKIACGVGAVVLVALAIAAKPAHDGAAKHLDMLAAFTPGGRMGVTFSSSSCVSVPNIRDQYISGGVVKPGAIGDGITDDSAAVRYWLGQAKGLLRVPGPYKYRIGSSCPFVNDGTAMWGDGQASSVFLLDDGFDAFPLHSLRNCSIERIGIDSTSGSTRTSGYAIRAWGGTATAGNQFPNFTAISKGGHLFDVDMNHQFNGIGFEDESGRGDWGTAIGTMGRQSTWNNFGSGGVGIFFNTYDGGPETVNNVSLTCANGTGCGAAIVYRGSGLITINGVVSNGMGGGFVSDPNQNPSVAGDGVALLNNCVFDSTDTAGTADNILINPGSGFSGTLDILMSNVWVAGARANGLHVTGKATGVSLAWSSGECFENQQWGVLVDNGAGNVAIGVTKQTAGVGAVIFRGNVSGDLHYF